MLSFIKHHMTTINGIEIYPIISLVIFVLFFSALIFYVFTVDKKSIEEVSHYPLEDEPKKQL